MPQGGRAPLDLDMADVEAARHIARQRVVPEHGHTLEDGVAVAGQLALGEHRGTRGVGGNDGPGGTHVVDALYQYVALGVHDSHGLGSSTDISTAQTQLYLQRPTTPCIRSVPSP